MKTLLRLLFLMISVSAFAESPRLNDDGSILKDRILKVMSYNIHHCNPPSAGDKIDVAAIARVISKEKPDFVALQEVDVNTERSGKGSNQAKELAKLTGMNFYFQKPLTIRVVIMALQSFPNSLFWIRPDLPSRLQKD